VKKIEIPAQITGVSTRADGSLGIRITTKELDPKYTDVIIQRYIDYTGNENIIKNGKPIIWKKSEKTEK